MQLIEVVAKLENFDSELTIFVQKPWTHEASAIVTTEPDVGALQIEHSSQVYEYFLEVFIALELFENSDPSMSADAKCERLIYYAVNDA